MDIIHLAKFHPHWPMAISHPHRLNIILSSPTSHLRQPLSLLSAIHLMISSISAQFHPRLELIHLRSKSENFYQLIYTSQTTVFQYETAVGFISTKLYCWTETNKQLSSKLTGNLKGHFIAKRFSCQFTGGLLTWLEYTRCRVGGGGGVE